MTDRTSTPTVRVSLLALPESTAYVLYGHADVLSSVGSVWTCLTGETEPYPTFDVRIVAPQREPFRCAGGVPVIPDATLAESGQADVVVISDLTIDVDADPRGRWPDAVAWIRAQHAGGAVICSVCSGSVLLADTGLLDGEAATTHWAFTDLFARCFPAIRLVPDRILVSAGPDHRLISSGGAASWEDLALHLIRRYCGRAAAIRTAKAFVFGDRSEGQQPYAAMAKPRRHEDAAIADCQTWVADHYAGASPVARMVRHSGLPERTFKRRFRATTGYTPVAYVQTLRIEEAKQLLETTPMPADEIGATVGYEDPASFRRLFKRQTGVTPGRYRQRFRTVGGATGSA